MADDTFYYFGYGSNMLLKKLQNDGSDGRPKRCPTAKPICICWVENYEFSFGKLSQNDGSGKGNITKTENDKSVVYGVLFRIPENEKNALTDAEGAKNSRVGERSGRYERIDDFEVQTEKSDEFPDGVAKTVTYIATGTGTDDKTMQPFDWYKEQIVHGAIEGKLPVWYIKKIQQDFTTKTDKNRERDKLERAYLPS